MSGGKFNAGGHFPDRAGLPLTGGTLTGALIVSSTIAATGKVSSSAAGTAFEATAGSFESAAASALAFFATNGGMKAATAFGFDCMTAATLPIGGTTASGVIVAKAAGTVGFYGGAGAAKGSVTGSRGGNAALASLLTLLASLGLLTDSSS